MNQAVNEWRSDPSEKIRKNQNKTERNRKNQEKSEKIRIKQKKTGISILIFLQWQKPSEESELARKTIRIKQN